MTDLVPLVALVVLLAVAYAHPRGRTEAAIGILAAAATLATGALSRQVLTDELGRLGPVVGFLVAILVVSESTRTAGVFRALGARLGRVPTRQRLLAATFALATIVTVALSLDATVVLLTPVVLAASRTRLVASELACVRLANSASLLVPVANLTNLLALPRLDLTFGRFALLMAPSWLAVLAVEYAVLRLRYRTELRLPIDGDARPLPAIPVFPVVVVLLMLVGFVAASPFGIQPVWVALVAAIVLTARDLATRRTTPARVGHSAHVPFAVYVLCLGIVVAGLGTGWFGERVASLVPDRTDLVGLLLIAALGAVLSNVVNNLPATLLLVPVVAPLGTTSLLALLIGVNVGSSLTWTGSLANLLWRRTLQAADRQAPTRDFHLTALLAAPVGIALGVVVLDGWSALVG